MKIFDEKRSGWRQTFTYKSEGYDASDKKLRIVTSQVFGDLKVW
jgi:predicted membrane protein